MLRFGAIKTYAHRLLRGEPIPIFKDRRTNRAIDAHVARIRAAKTHKRRKGR